MVFAGQRWIVLDVDDRTNTLFVAPHPGGAVPRFERTDGERIHDRLVAEVHSVYLASDRPTYLTKERSDCSTKVDARFGSFHSMAAH
jgi:ATP-dependent helicase Lhr and Lhr-like helicase